MQKRRDCRKLRQHYVDWLLNTAQLQHVPYLGSVWFEEFNGPSLQLTDMMESTLRQFYSNLVQQCVSQPKRKSKQKCLPRMLAFPDMIFNRRGEAIKSAKRVPNNGTAYHFFCLHYPTVRVADLQSHLIEKQQWYRERVPQLLDVTAKPITETPEKAISYMFKYWGKGVFNSEQVLLLPEY